MHIPTHILSGWCIGNCFPLNKQQRLFCMIAAAIPDVDGIGFVFGEDWYWKFHHILGHNVFFGLLTAGALAAIGGRKRLTFPVYLALFHLHLVMDYFGSGPGWKIHYFWPVSQVGYKTDWVWNLTSWQNMSAAVVLLAWTAVIVYLLRRTPLELISPRLDRVGVDAIARRRQPTSVEPTHGDSV